MSNLKTGGLRDLLEQLAADRPAAVPEEGNPSPEAWTPVV